MILKECTKELIKMEESASKFYDSMAEVAEPRLYDAMKKLAREEEGHMRALISLLGSSEGQDDVISQNAEKALVSQQLLIKEGIGESCSQKDLFKFALTIEEKSVEIYKQLAEEFEYKEMHGKTFTDFIQEEKKHMMFILKILYDLK